MNRRVTRVALAVLLLAVSAPSAGAQDPGRAPPDAAVVADLVVDLGSAESHVRDQARDRLVKLGEAVVPNLVLALDGANVRARVEAARALGAIGAAAKSAAPWLRKAAGSADPETLPGIPT